MGRDYEKENKNSHSWITCNLWYISYHDGDNYGDILNKKLFGIILGFIAVLGVWLIYWDIVDFMTTGLNTGLWDWTIVESGLPSIIAGIVIVCIAGYYGIKMLF